MGIADADRTAWERSIEGGRPRSRLDAFFDGTDIAEIRAALAASRSPDTRERDRSFGRVRSPETRNGRTGKPEHGGLECCRIFGPVDEDQCLCGAQRGGGICSKCGVECGDPSVRDWRFGHIALPRAVLHPAAVGRAAVQLGIAEDALRAALQRELGPFGTRLQGGGGERLADLPEGCTIDLVPVPPPGDRPDALRLGADGSLVRHAHPMVGALRRVVNLSNRLQRLIELNAPDVILDNEHDFLQQAVFDLVEGREAVVAVEPLAVDGIRLGDREAWFGPGEACEAALLWLADGVLVQEATGLRLLGPDGETRATWPPHLCRIAYAMGRYVVALGPYPAVDDGTVLDVAVLDLDSGWLDTWPDGLPCRLVQHEQPEEAFLVDALAGTRVRVGTWSDRPTAEAWAPDGSLCWMSDAGYGGALVDVAGNVLRTLRLDEDPEWSFDAATSEVRPIAEHRPYDVRAGVQAAVGACGTAGPRPDWHVAGPDGLVGALDLARLRVIGPFRAFAFALDGARLAVLGPDCVWVVRLEERGPPVVEGRL
ncbi:MAG: hypothetical protein H6737_02875 [Alphaproteobacteria bacterium]|nr:hypothetical protein [Alphaproteobacteria bacterium]